MIDHITIYVTDLDKSKIFYTQALAPLGYKVSFGEPGHFWAFDVGNEALFEIAQINQAQPITPCHVAFRANSQEQVEQFYQAALAAGGQCNGAPGPRPQYTKHYYAAFVLDFDKHNIEAVIKSS